jgi:hypothetical protein
MTTTEATPIQVPFPDAADLHLKIQAGACRIRIRPGADADWVSGAYTDPSGMFPCRVIEESGGVTIAQRYESWTGRVTGPARFELALGTARPYQVTIESGATESDFDFGGLPLTRLALRQGAGKYDINFSAPNPEPMSQLEISAGAVGLNAHNLANANAAEIRIDGGAAAYKLVFGGALQRATHAHIATGLSGVELEVPASTAVKITAEAVLGGVDIGDGFMKKEGAFWNEAALAGKTPVLTVHANVALGGLKLRQSAGPAR